MVFDAEARARHRAAKERLSGFLARTRPLVVLTAPVIYAMVVSLGLLDLTVTLYQRVCFPVFRVPKIRRGAYVFLDRHQLGSLDGLQKLNCVYCGYANGVIAYAREVAAHTEQYWCPIKHSRALPDPHSRYPGILPFGDAESFREGLEAQRAELDEGR